MDLRVSLRWLFIFMCNEMLRHCGGTSLDLSGSSLDQSTLGPLDSYPGLSILTLDNNQFTNFPNLTDVADSLETLYLRYNPITVLDQLEINDPTVTLPSVLSTLDMTGCQLTVFPNVTFLQGSLTNIILNKNLISSIPSSYLEGMSISSLELDENSLDEWPAGIHVIRDTLNVLRISKNPMTNITLPPNTPPLKVDYFYMTQNYLISLPPIASVIGTLFRYVYLASTMRSGYRPIPDDVLNATFPNAIFITLGWMKLLNLPKLGPCPKLTTFDYNGNIVTEISVDHVVNAPLLSALSFTYKMSMSIPAFGIFGNFQMKLTLSGSYKVTHLPDYAFEGNFLALTTLDIQNTGLEVFPKFGYMPNLITLVAGLNLYTFIPCDAFDGMASLRTLNLDNTGIKTLHDVTVQSPLLTTLRLPTNQMSCDCTMYWLREQELVHSNLLYDTTLLCGQGDFTGQPLNTVTLTPCSGFGNEVPETYGKGTFCDPKRSILVKSAQVSSKISCAAMCTTEEVAADRFEVEPVPQGDDPESSVTCKCMKDACETPEAEQTLNNMHLVKMKNCL